MSKKRKTRKQKELAKDRKATVGLTTINPIPTYSIDIKEKKTIIPNASRSNFHSAEKNNYLKQDILKIATASGIVFAFDMLLLALVSKEIIKLSMFGL